MMPPGKLALSAAFPNVGRKFFRLTLSVWGEQKAVASLVPRSSSSISLTRHRSVIEASQSFGRRPTATFHTTTRTQTSQCHYNVSYLTTEVSNLLASLEATTSSGETTVHDDAAAGPRAYPSVIDFDGLFKSLNECLAWPKLIGMPPCHL